MNTFVSATIYFYIIICIALLAFNIVYILRAKARGRAQDRRADKWRKKIADECDRLEHDAVCAPSHCRMLERRLKKVTALMAYYEATTVLLESCPQQMRRYLDSYQNSFLILAETYRSHSPMERAFYAWLMSVYCPNGPYTARICEVILEYFERSTIFCRENILRALCAMGRMDAVEQAFSIMNAKGWHHDRHLLADGLSGFVGDKEKLAWYLWKRSSEWNEVFQVAIVQFATGISDVFAQEFLRALTDSTTPLETRFALVRYFQRWYSFEAYAVLLEFLSEGKDSGGLAIAAASALGNYPQDETRRELLLALHGRNYYVRRNAAFSLKKLGITQEEALSVWKSGDRYAIEILEYILGRGANTPVSSDTDREEADSCGLLLSTS